ncbi:MAG: GDSL-type esterase/lipase family protein, partial [Eubacterium sp.]|nr:GDSL-type esterase/lipase family protein [Eubacterium sp.]
GVQVLTQEEVVTMACFGDSITHMSYYFDPLLESLYEKYPSKISLLNCGIGGNRVLYDACYVEEIPGHGRCFGNAGIRRFERDVYEDVEPDIVFLMEGVNDCTHGLAFHVPGEVPTGKQIYEGIKEMVEIGHARGSKVYLSTIMPFGCYEDSFREEAETIRQEANELIRRNQTIADGFLDLDEIMRKEEDIHFMKDGMHLGDGVHPNEAGGGMIAKAIGQKISFEMRKICPGGTKAEE